MMYNSLIGDDDASTPLTVEEQDELRLSYITNRDELNEAEHLNITKAVLWSNRSRKSFLSESFLKALHLRMFGDVWKWAGKYRQSQRNIGIDAYRIPVEVNSLFKDIEYWHNNKIFSPTEIGARLHHKLVYIHPFPNGNGRCSRLITDVFMKKHFNQYFTWGSEYKEINERRKLYVHALREADKHSYEKIIKFVAS